MFGPTHYAKAGEASVAWAERGSGPHDIVFCGGFLSHVEHLTAYPALNGLWDGADRFARVILFDRRGSGLSDRMTAPPTLEEQMEDITAVLDAAGSERAALLGFVAGGSLSALYAATYPERVSALVLLAAFARSQPAEGYDWPPSVEERAGMREQMVATWGNGTRGTMLFPSLAGDPAFLRWFGELERLSSGPGDARKLFSLLDAIDVRGVLPTIQAPTLVAHPADQEFVDVRHSEYLAEHIPGARLVLLPGGDVYPVEPGPRDLLLGEIEELLTGSRSGPEPTRALATVLFTDIVDSTREAARLGDRAWTGLISRHENIVREELRHWGGNEIKTLGDGFLATFDGPTSAVRCALLLTSRGAEGLPIRAGVHVGEIERRGEDVGGIAVHIGARVSALAGAGEVLVSRTVKDLTVGSGLVFEERGARELKGVPGSWELFAAGEN